MTLQSTQTAEYFPGNSGGDFTVHLGKTLKFANKAFEVGISQLYYTPPDPPKDENGNYITKKQKFFGNATGDNQIKLKKQSPSGFTMDKTTDEITSFVSEVNKQLEERNYGVNIRLVISAKGHFFQVDNSRNKKEGIAISARLCHAMGFDKSSFDFGKHLAVRTYSQSEFAALPNDAIFEIELYVESEYTVSVSEPRQYNIKFLLAAINEALDDHGCAFDLEVGVLEFDITVPGVMAKLSPEICQFLGVPSDVWFHANHMRVDANPNLVLYHESQFMLIMCSCAKDQVYGSSLLPILRTIPIPTKYGEQIEYIFSPIQYITISGTEVSEIRVHILDDQLRPMPVASRPSTIVLHFRERPL